MVSFALVILTYLQLTPLGIPFGFATAMGLGCVALTGDPRFPTYPDSLTADQVSAGLSSPATAIALMGKGGAVLLLILLFMAVTSSTSAELIAVSSLLTFDVYKTYFRSDATSAKLVQVSHWGIVIYATVLAAFCSILNAVGLNLTWLLTVLGIIVGGGSVPVGLVLLWGRMSTVATIAAPWIGLACGLISWLITTSKRSGSISVTTSGDTLNALAGNITSWGVGFIVAVVFSFIFPKKHTSTHPSQIERSNKIEGIAVPTSSISEAGSSEKDTSTSTKQNAENNVKSPDQKPEAQTEAQPASASAPEAEVFIPTGNEMVDYLQSSQIEPMDPVLIQKATRLAWGANLVFLSVAIILVPFTLFGTRYVFSKTFFTGWVVVSFIWVWASMTICVIYPVVSRTRISCLFRSNTYFAGRKCWCVEACVEGCFC